MVFQHSALVVCCSINQMLQTVCALSVWNVLNRWKKWELDQVRNFFITLVWSLSNIRTQTICCMGLKYLIFPRGRQHMPPLHVIQPRRAETDCNMKYAGQRGVASLVDVKMTGAANQIKEGGLYCSQKPTMNCEHNTNEHKASVLTVKENKDITKHLIFDNCFLIKILENVV